LQPAAGDAAAAESRPHIDRSVAALLVSVFCSSAASLAQATALGKLVYDLTGSELDLGLLGLAEFAPAALLVLVTGAVADRFDRRRVTAVGAVGEMALAAVLAWYAGRKPTAVLPIFVMVFGFGVARAFAAPASRSLPAEMVSGDRLPWLVARHSGAWQAAVIAGPVDIGLGRPRRRRHGGGGLRAVGVVSRPQERRSVPSP
jgi:MFS family permease